MVKDRHEMARAAQNVFFLFKKLLGNKMYFCLLVFCYLKVYYDLLTHNQQTTTHVNNPSNQILERTGRNRDTNSLRWQVLKVKRD